MAFTTKNNVTGERDKVNSQTVYVDKRVGYRRLICDLRLSKINGNTEMEVWFNEYTTVNTKVKYLRPSSRHYVEILIYKMLGSTDSISYVGVDKTQHTSSCNVGRKQSK